MANQYFTLLPHKSPPHPPLQAVTMLVIFLNSHCSTSHTQGMDAPPAASPPHHRPAGKKRTSVREPAGDQGVYWQQNYFFLFFFSLDFLIDHFFFLFFFSFCSPSSSQAADQTRTRFSPSRLELMSVVIDMACTEILLAAAQTILHVGVNNVRFLEP